MSIGTLPRVEPKHLTFDVAGNLTKDKDAYQYEYDYENRIVKITKNSQTKAEFAYDALATRVEKKDLVDSANTRQYYYNYNWQVLCSYDNAGTLHRWHAFGNYIDELLMRGLNQGLSSPRFFSHDHLYSPVVLLRTTGRIGERYKYDAYGQPTIMDASYNTRQTSIDGNPYLFTGRQADILDNGSLTIQYSRNRYYDYYTGRFTTHDPMGITLATVRQAFFAPQYQYHETENLYEYSLSNPCVFTDPFGLSLLPKITLPEPCGYCKLDVKATIHSIKKKPLKPLACWLVPKFLVKMFVNGELKKHAVHTYIERKCKTPKCACRYMRAGKNCYFINIYPERSKKIMDCIITIKLAVNIQTCLGVGICHEK